MNRPTTHTVVAALLLTFALIATGCSHRADSAEHKAIDANVLRALHGSWLSYEYMVSIEASHSPMRSAAHMDGLISFLSDTGHISHDTLYLTGLVRGHESHELSIYLGSRDSAGCYPVSQLHAFSDNAAPGDKLVKARLSDRYLTLYTHVSDSIRYIRYDRDPRSHPVDYVVKKYTTQALFSGTYTTPDSAVLFRSSLITFDPASAGSLHGSPAYDSFDINIDVLAQTDTLDYMEFYDTHGRSESRSYRYHIDKDQIIIAPLTEGPVSRLRRQVADSSAAE